jgi:hypothetical protein
VESIKNNICDRGSKTADKKTRKYVAIVIYGLWQMGEGRPAVYSIIELNDNVLLFTRSYIK